MLLYEDRDLLVVDKPAGLLSIAAGGQEKTAYWITAEYLRKKGEKRRPAVVHRLDRDTSGIMIFAKSEQVKRRFMERWKELVTERRYVAVVEGGFGSGAVNAGTAAGRRVPAAEGRIDAPLGEDSGGRVIVREGGKPAITRWKLLASKPSWGKDKTSWALLSLELETGRRNQIRAHLAWLGYPVAGDKKYRAKTDPLGRLCLHAVKIAFHHPKDGRVMEFESPLPRGFEDLVKKDGKPP
jgi:23S rRNA pseudouridine1911/1915/1917 synthase